MAGTMGNSYLSTRGQAEPQSFTGAVATGLVPDGGLYVPATLPDVRTHLPAWEKLSYPELADAFFALFADDLDPSVRQKAVATAYASFAHPETAPLVELGPGQHVLELFHGPTLAFKDFALQLLGELYAAQIERTGESVNILGATSGDTGAAAIHGLRGKPGVKIFMLYPQGGVSPLQERQMTCTGDPTVFPLAIEGTFDDAQDIIKTLFGDLTFRAAHRLSAVNSINLARVLAQCVYYFYAWFRLPAADRDGVEFIVPTGNFGNVLAGWWAQKMGLPIARFRVATNQNDILYRLFTTGTYEVAPVAPSVAPSMDIQVASNFERFLYVHEQGDPARVREIIATFRQTGRYAFRNFQADTFTASRVDDAGIGAIIARIYRETGYVCDPHTACAFANPPKDRPFVALGTAHPAKFPSTVEDAIGQTPTAPALEALKQKPIVNHPLPASAEAVRTFIAEHA